MLSDTRPIVKSDYTELKKEIRSLYAVALNLHVCLTKRLVMVGVSFSIKRSCLLMSDLISKTSMKDNENRIESRLIGFSDMTNESDLN